MPEYSADSTFYFDNDFPNLSHTTRTMNGSMNGSMHGSMHGDIQRRKQNWDIYTQSSLTDYVYETKAEAREDTFTGKYPSGSNWAYDNDGYSMTPPTYTPYTPPTYTPSTPSVQTQSLDTPSIKALPPKKNETIRSIANIETFRRAYILQRQTDKHMSMETITNTLLRAIHTHSEPFFPASKPLAKIFANEILNLPKVEPTKNKRPSYIIGRRYIEYLQTRGLITGTKMTDNIEDCGLLDYINNSGRLPGRVYSIPQPHGFRYPGIYFRYTDTDNETDYVLSGFGHILMRLVDNINEPVPEPEIQETTVQETTLQKPVYKNIYDMSNDMSESGSSEEEGWWSHYAHPA